MRHHIRKLVLPLVFLLLATAVVATGGFLYFSQRKSCREEAERDLKAIADLKTRELAAWRNRRLEEAGVFYGNKSFSDLVRRCADQPQDGKLQQELRNWIGHFQSSLHYDQVSLLDAACNEWISVPAAPCGHSSLTIQKARESIRSQQIVFADFYPNESTRKDYLRLFVPVLDDSSDHRLLGVLMLRIDPEAYLAPFIQRWPVPSSTGEMVLLRREGNEVLVLDALWFQNNSGLALRMPLDRNEDLFVKAVLSQDGFVDGVDYRGMPSLGVVRAVPDSPWLLVAKMDAAEAYALMHRWFWLSALFVSVLLGSLRAVWGVRWQARHLSLLREKCEAESKFHMITDAARDAILMMDDQGRISYWNPAAERILGYAKDEAMGQDLHRLLVPNRYLASHDAAFPTFQQAGTGAVFGKTQELAARRKDGVEIAVTLSLSAVQIGGKWHAVGVLRDVTEQKWAETLIRESETRYRTLADSGQALIWTSGLDKKCDYFNESWLKFTGRPLEQELGNGWTEGVHPDDLPHCVEVYGNAFDRRERFNMDYRLRHHSGEYRWIQDSGTPRYDGDGNFQGYIGHCLDITDHKRAEEALKKNEAMLACVLNSVPQSIFWKDRNSTYIGCNNVFARRAGLRPEDVVGKTDFDFPWSPKEAEAYREDDREVMASRRPKFRIIEQQHQPDGACIWVETTKVPLVDSDGQVYGILGAYDDITERRRMEDEIRLAKDAAEAATRAKSRFLAQMSHEIRTPMTAILGFADVLHDEVICCPVCAANERCQRRYVASEAVDVIKRNGQYLLGLINDILDLSKVEAGKLQVESVRCSPVELVAEVASLMRVRAEAKQLMLETRFVAPLPETVLTDPLRLRQILVNLVGNAIKFTEQGKVSLVVRLSRDGEKPRLCVDVTDTGIGLDESQIAGLFQPFVQVDALTARRFEGTGLGLCLSKRIAEALGGTVEVRSIPRQGSTFTVTIDSGPLDGIRLIQDIQEVLSGRTPTAAAAASVAALHGRVLLAEDGPDNRRLISVLLEKAGADVTMVENGQLAVEAAIVAGEGGSPFDVILMDMQMPVMDGYVATHKLREQGYTAPIVALTAHAMTEDAQKCLDAGCDDYTTKPIDRPVFLATVANWIDRSRSRDALPHEPLNR